MLFRSILTKVDASTVNAGNVRGPAGPNTTFVTSLPGSPADGDEVYLQTAAMATATACWHLRFRTTLNKWEFVGGARLYKGGESLNTAPGGDGIWAELSATTTLTIPVAGVYDVWFGGSLQENIGDNASADVFMSLYKNGASVTNMSEAWVRFTQAYQKASIRNTTRLTFAASDVIRPRGAVSSGNWNNYRWKSAFVTATPVTLG